MEQGVSAIIIAMLVVFVFIPALFMGMLNSNRQKINEAMYLSTKCIMDCVETDSYSMDDLAMGNAYNDPIFGVKIDEAKCFTEFDSILYNNLGNIDEYVKVKNNILCEMIIYPDRYVVYDQVNYGDEVLAKYSAQEQYDNYVEGKKDLNVSAPKYFTYKKVSISGDDEIVPVYYNGETNPCYLYINAIDSKVRRFGVNKSWSNITENVAGDYFKSKLHYKYEEDEINISDYNNNRLEYISTYDKNQVIIDTINKEISYYTNGVTMEFINPASVRQANLKATKQDFNFFTGITFLVIYREDNLLATGGELFSFNQYTAAGFTLEY